MQKFFEIDIRYMSINNVLIAQIIIIGSQMKNLFCILSLSLSFTLACGDTEKSADEKATGPEAEANEACTCMHKALAVAEQGRAAIKKSQKECMPKIEALKKKYKGGADEGKVKSIMDTCQKDFKAKMREKMKAQKNDASKGAPSKDIKKGAPSAGDVKKGAPPKGGAKKGDTPSGGEVKKNP